jgi:hypothetical protein
MKCGFCGYEFEPADAQSACEGCPLVPGCHLLRCPRCGYEMPPEAKLITLLRTWRGRALRGRALREHSQDEQAHVPHPNIATTKEELK